MDMVQRGANLRYLTLFEVEVQIHTTTFVVLKSVKKEKALLQQIRQRETRIY